MKLKYRIFHLIEFGIITSVIRALKVVLAIEAAREISLNFRGVNHEHRYTIL